MSDIVLLGIICLGLALYCLYLMAKLKFFMYATQMILRGIHDDIAIVVERDGKYYPEIKKEIKKEIEKELA